MFRHTNVFLVLFDITVWPKTDNLIKRTRHTKQQTAALNLRPSKYFTSVSGPTFYIKMYCEIQSLIKQLSFVRPTCAHAALKRRKHTASLPTFFKLSVSRKIRKNKINVLDVTLTQPSRLNECHRGPADYRHLLRYEVVFVTQIVAH